MASRARSEGQVDAHMKADIPHRGCSLEEVVQFIYVPKCSEKVGFLVFDSGLCPTYGFQGEGLRVGMHIDMSAILSARTLTPSGLEGYASIARHGSKGWLGCRTKVRGFTISSDGQLFAGKGPIIHKASCGVGGCRSAGRNGEQLKHPMPERGAHTSVGSAVGHHAGGMHRSFKGPRFDQILGTSRVHLVSAERLLLRGVLLAVGEATKANEFTRMHK